MTRHGLIAVVSTALLLTGAPAASARQDAGDTVSIDLDTVEAGSGRKQGWRQAEATVQLARPVHYAAREITQEVQTQDWDCPGRRYRVILRVFRTASGEFVRSERGFSPWTPVPKEGPAQKLFETLCPAEQP